MVRKDGASERLVNALLTGELSADPFDEQRLVLNETSRFVGHAIPINVSTVPRMAQNDSPISSPPPSTPSGDARSRFHSANAAAMTTQAIAVPRAMRSITKASPGDLGNWWNCSPGSTAVTRDKR